MQVTHFEAQVANRPDFKSVFPSLYPLHRDTQKAMFGAAREAHLPTDTPEMIEGINVLLGLALESRKQLSIREMERATQAIERGAFGPDWSIRDDFTIGLFSLSDVELDTMEPPTDLQSSPCLGFHVSSPSIPATLEVVEIQNRLADAARDYELEVMALGARLLERKIELRSRIGTLRQVLRSECLKLSEDACYELRRMVSSARSELALLDSDYPTI